MKASLDHNMYVLLENGVKWKKKVGTFLLSVVGLGAGVPGDLTVVSPSRNSGVYDHFSLVLHTDEPHLPLRLAFLLLTSGRAFL